VGGPGPYAALSADGVQWTRQFPGALSDGQNLLGVTYGNGLFVAVGSRPRAENPATTQPLIRTSSNTNWPHQTFVAPASLEALRAAGYGNGTYVVVGDEGTILSSPDATNWTLRASGTTRTLRAVTYYNGRFIVGGDVGTILASADGTTWSPASPTSFSNRGLASGDGVVSIGNFQDEGRLHYSSDGLSWPGNSQNCSEVLNGVAHGNGAWVAVGNGGLILQGVSHEIRLSDPHYSNGNFEMTIHWQPGRSYRIQTSANLVDWHTIMTWVADSPTFAFRIRTIMGNYFRVVSP
jgi:hypothetical protein